MNKIQLNDVLTVGDLNQYRAYILSQSTQKDCIDFLTFIEKHYRKDGLFYYTITAKDDKNKYNKIQLFTKFKQAK